MTAKEIEQSFQEIWELFKETDRKFKETDRKFKETDQKFKETDRKFEKTEQILAKRHAETEKVIQDVGREIEELGKKVEQVNESVNKLTGKWGRFVEGLILPAVQRLFQERGIRIEQVFQRARVERNGARMEIDILASDSEYAVLIEAKSTLTVDDVREHLDRLQKFKTFFPLYRDHKVVGAVAGIVIEEGVDRFAYRSGLFVIGQKGDTVTILNDKKFVPKKW